MAARDISSALYPCKTTFSPSPAEHSPPPSILPHTFVRSGMASELLHVGGETIGLYQPTSLIRQPTVRRVHFGVARTYRGGERTIRGDSAPGLSGPGQRHSWKIGNSNYSCRRSLTGGLAQVQYCETHRFFTCTNTLSTEKRISRWNLTGGKVKDRRIYCNLSSVDTTLELVGKNKTIFSVWPCSGSFRVACRM